MHDPYTYPSMEEKIFHILPGYEINAAVTKSEVNYLKPPYSKKDCVKATQLQDYANLALEPPYSYESCLIKCVNDFMFKCNCSFFTQGQDACSLYDALACAIPYLINDLSYLELKNCSFCLPLCSAVEYKVELSYLEYPNMYVKGLPLRNETLLKKYYVGLNVYYDTMRYSVTTQLPALKLEGLLSSFGGLMGLCLGASALSVLELLDFVCTSCMQCFSRSIKVKKIVSTPQNQQNQNSVSPRKCHK